MTSTVAYPFCVILHTNLDFVHTNLDRKVVIYLAFCTNTIGTIGRPKLARFIHTLIANSRIYYSCE